MARINNLNSGGSNEIKRRLWQSEISSNLGHSSISRGALKINSVEGLQVDGSSFTRGRMEGSGTFDWTGPMWLRGAITGVGAFTFSGPCTFTGVTLLNGTTTANGDLAVTKTLDVTGATRLRAAATLENDLTLTSGGKIIAGDISMAPAIGIYSSNILQIAGLNGTAVRGTLNVSSNLSALNGTLSGTLGVTGKATLGSLAVGGAKQFIIDHPTKPGWKLGHGSTESPVSGIEYWGSGELDANGAVTIRLPDYFDALARPNGRVAMVSGNGFIARWEWSGGSTIHVTGGVIGDHFTWLVKAERYGADFVTEMPPEDYSLANSVQ